MVGQHERNRQPVPALTASLVIAAVLLTVAAAGPAGARPDRLAVREDIPQRHPPRIAPASTNAIAGITIGSARATVIDRIGPPSDKPYVERWADRKHGPWAAVDYDDTGRVSYIFYSAPFFTPRGDMIGETFSRAVRKWREGQVVKVGGRAMPAKNIAVRAAEPGHWFVLAFERSRLFAVAFSRHPNVCLLYICQWEN